MTNPATDYVVTVDDTPLSVHVARLEALVTFGDTVRFVDLLPLEVTRAYAIGVFLALLELLKRRRIEVSQDEEYGRDRSEREYAVHDTRRPLLEAKRQRISPFLITVDSSGHDYLRHMCDAMGYEVVADIESLPRRLPKLYRHLAGD